MRSLIENTWSDATVTDVSSLADALETPRPTAHGRIVVVDPWRAGADVGELVKRLTAELDAPVVIFTADGGARLLTESLKAGVRGYVRKDSPPEDLVRAIRAAQAGEFYVDPSLSSTIVLEEGDRTLSARQREILQMLANGLQTEAVANQLGPVDRDGAHAHQAHPGQARGLHAHAGGGHRPPLRPDSVVRC